MTQKTTPSNDGFASKSAAFEAADDIPNSPVGRHTIGDVIALRFGRRDFLKGALGVSVSGALFSSAALVASSGARANSMGNFEFEEVAGGIDTTHHVAPGHAADVLLRWGDPLFSDAPDFDPTRQTPAAQLRQFGYNNDYVAFFPQNSDGTRALLCVNHEYTNEELMFPGLGRQDRSDFKDMTRALVDVEMAAHGVSIVELALRDNQWQVEREGKANRRISPLQTRMSLDGPAAGNHRLQTKEDPSGRSVIGTINNCAGGQTPWGTYLTAEENFHGYFWTDKRDPNGRRKRKGLGGELQASYDRYGVPGNWYCWGRYHDRFNVDKEPNEPFRFGWIVEIDPSDPQSVPVKHTALGRFRHEGAETVLNKDGRVVVYSGDDARFDYVYRFVSRDKYRSDNKAANMKLLSVGELSVARFNSDGTLTWLPLKHGHGPLTSNNGFASQADVLIDARLAADRLGATPMDRPEDVQPNHKTGKVYVMLTNNYKRTPDKVDAANPRSRNLFGHVIEISPPDGDHAVATHTWNILLKCGDPNIGYVGAQWHPETTQSGWFASPDNCTVDADGRLWIATDQGRGWSLTGKADGLFAVETAGELRGLSRMFFRVPIGAEMCGPCFTPDGTTLFVAVQHPAADGTKAFKPFAATSTFDNPATRWPDFRPDLPPRPSVLAIRRPDGRKIA